LLIHSFEQEKTYVYLPWSGLKATLSFEMENKEKAVWRRAAEAALADITEDHSVLGPKIVAFREGYAKCES
jgi:hypothetical protein